MAEERKKGAASLYGKPPKIERDERDGDTPKSGGGAPKEAEKKAEESAGKPKTETESKSVGKSGTEAKGDVMAGTDGIETNHVHSAERMEAHHRRMHEHGELMHRHEREHLLRSSGHMKESHEEMSKRHHGEMRAMHTRHERDHKEMGERQASAPMSADAPAPMGAAPAPGGAAA